MCMHNVDRNVYAKCDDGNSHGITITLQIGTKLMSKPLKPCHANTQLPNGFCCKCPF